MRHLLTAIIVIVSAAFTLISGKCTAHKSFDTDINTLETVTSDTADNSVAYNDSVSDTESAHTEYEKLPIAESGNIKVYVNYCLEDKGHQYGDDIYAKD